MSLCRGGGSMLVHLNYYVNWWFTPRIFFSIFQKLVHYFSLHQICHLIRWDESESPQTKNDGKLSCTEKQREVRRPIQRVPGVQDAGWLRVIDPFTDSQLSKRMRVISCFVICCNASIISYVCFVLLAHFTITLSLSCSTPCFRVVWLNSLTAVTAGTRGLLSNAWWR